MSSIQETNSFSKISFDRSPSVTFSKELPSDIIFEILTRTSLETLDACKSVCHGWNRMTRELTFMPAYCDRMKTLSGYFIQATKRNNYVSMFVSPGQNSPTRNMIGSDTRILASSNHGILCCQRRHGVNLRYYVCKPATQQWRTLPNPKLRYQTVAMAIMVIGTKPLHYKIIRLSERDCKRDVNIHRFEIFDSKVWTWTTLQDLHLPEYEIINANPSISCSNSICWITNQNNVLQFHKGKQSFKIFSLPESVTKDQSYQCKQLVEYQGRLGLTCLTQDSTLELWVMQKDQSNSMKWMKKMMVNIQNLTSIVKHHSPLAFYNDRIVILKAFNEVVFYEVESHTFNILQLDYGITVTEELFEFRSDFEPADL